MKKRHPIQCALLAASLVPGLWAGLATAQPARPAGARQAAAPAVTAAEAPPRLACTELTSGPAVSTVLGKSQVVTLGKPAVRLIGAGRPSSWIGQPVETRERTPEERARAAAAGNVQQSDGVADTEITLLSPTEILVVGRRPGSSNVIVQDRDGRCIVRDILVTLDPQALESNIAKLLPNEKELRVTSTDNAVILSGNVRDSSAMDQVLSLAGTYGESRKVINLMRVSAPQQVMLEVKIAEVSKSLLDRFGLDFSRSVAGADRASLITGIIGGGPGVLGSFRPNVPGAPLTGSFGSAVGGGTGSAGATWQGAARNGTLLGLDIENRDGLVRVLAEPNIMAISGQSASFLSGGKLFIPVAQSRDGGGSTITLEEKQFGVGLNFTPTVLDGRINLKMTSEASELSQTGAPFTTVGGVTSVLPSLSTRKVDTTVQLGDGQSFVVAGLIKNNVTQSVSKFPGLGDLPVVGALFRSTEFQNDKTELMFVVTPRLVKPMTTVPVLPTDNHVAPQRNDGALRGIGEGSAPPPATPAPAPAPALQAPATTTP